MPDGLEERRVEGKGEAVGDTGIFVSRPQSRRLSTRSEDKSRGVHNW